jgi:hypothetical protein
MKVKPWSCWSKLNIIDFTFTNGSPSETNSKLPWKDLKPFGSCRFIGWNSTVNFLRR